jgi:hypothetical protein
MALTACCRTAYAVGNRSGTGTSKSAQHKCDQQLWKHVWTADRLSVIDSCVEMTGTVRTVRYESDGDLHILLVPDKNFEHMMNDVNRKKLDGNLVVEMICVGSTKEKKAKAACQDYKNTLHIPQVGEHVRLSGSLVKDLHHGWNEIHPVFWCKRAD